MTDDRVAIDLIMGTRNHPLKTYNPVRHETSIHYLLICGQVVELKIQLVL